MYKMDIKKLIIQWTFLLSIALILHTIGVNCTLISGGSNVCTVKKQMTERYYTRCTVVFRCTRYRIKYVTDYECCEDWTTITSSSSSCTVPKCISGWNRCPNGGTCTTANYCACIQGYYSPDCEKCTDITNCNTHACTSATNQRCVTCDYEHDHVIRAYEPITSGGYPDRVCQKLCSWRSDSLQCYPGTCTDGTPDTCQCAPGFGGTDCMTITKTPDITDCSTVIFDSAGERLEIICDDVNSATKYTNMKPTRLQVDWKTQYKGLESAAGYAPPYYVNAFEVGLISVVAEWTMPRGSGTIECNSGISTSSPSTSLRSCVDDTQLPSTIVSSDVLMLSFKSRNGGRLQITNFDTSASSTSHSYQYYSGRTLTHTASFTFDFDPPYHCLATCADNMLDIGNPYTKQGSIRITWNGWNDALSGIQQYQFEVYKLKPYGTGDSALLDYRSEAPVAAGKMDSSAVIYPTVTLPDTGLYVVILIVFDGSKEEHVDEANHRLARRFLLFDNSSVVERSNHSDHQLFVQSAAANTSYEWITTLDEEVSITWKSHFYNIDHKNNLWLNAIESHTTDIDEDYEERTGQPYGKRSMEAIPNVNGIMRYDFKYATDHVGGRSLNSTPSTLERLVHFQNEEEARTIARVDGDSIKFWVKAFDIMNNTVVEDVLVHVDSSPPHIDKVGLLRDGQRLLAVHSNVDLFDMILAFDTYDYHSGMKQITWELFDMKDLAVHGQGAIPVVRPNMQNESCTPPECYCIEREEECFRKTYHVMPELMKMNISIGGHDHDYVFVIHVINNAMLQTHLEFQVTIDVSPPVTGHVFDAEPGQNDGDYQSSLQIPASWNGFFDRESGIKYYRYATHTACLEEDHFAVGGSPPVEIGTTFDTFTSETVNTSGTYYTTVVAYNHALEPSHPVCSDGITVDTTPPVVGSIHVKNAFIKPGLVSDGNDMMYMDGEGYVYELAVQTDNCSASSVDDVSNFETRTFPHPIKPQQDDCGSYASAGSTHYLATENMFEMTWAGLDPESTVHDYMIALSSTDTGYEDIMPYTSTHGHQHFITYHPNLVNMEEFYVNVKAVNKAGLETLKVIGPFQVRTHGPRFDSDIAVTHEKQNQDFLVATFDELTYNMDDVANDYLSSVEYSLGEGSCSRNVIPWTSINSTDNSLWCGNTWPPACVVIDTESHGFYLQDNTSYCLSVRLQAYNKLTTTINGWYRHNKELAGGGTLWEINPHDMNPAKKDIDYQTSTSSLHLRLILRGFDNTLNLQYQVGVGTTPGQDDVKSFDRLDKVELIDVVNLSLQYNTEYFTTIKIVDLDTDRYAMVASDGITVLPEDIILPGFSVHDGIPCNENELTSDRSLSHHRNLTGVPMCDVEIDYQTYTTVMSAYWNYTSTDSYVQYFFISVEKQDRNDENTWYFILSDYFVGNNTFVHLTGLHLEGGEIYRAVIQGCHPAGCYRPMKTNGVMILPTEPVARHIVAADYNDYNDSLPFISLTWDPFIDPYRGVDFDVINQYDIGIFVSSENSNDLNQITQWTHFQPGDYHVNPQTNQINATYKLDGKLEASSCLLVAVRGYNGAMLFATTYKEFKGCTVPDRIPLHIFDAVGERLDDGGFEDISLTANDAWLRPDAEYTASKTSLSAVWPMLRHGYIRWSVVHGDIVNRVAYTRSNLAHLNYWDFDCALPEVLACGSSYDRFVNVHELSLQEGSRYHVCFYANSTKFQHEKWEETLPEMTGCTNGITVDTEPPLGGFVWIGNRQQHSHFQSDSLVLVVHWSSFVDVEVHHRTAHHTGIKTYLLALGSTKGGRDVLHFQDVGLTTFKIITGLSLSNGVTYYVTIKAQDYVGLETSVVSQGVTIDSTHPDVDGEKFIVSGQYLTSDNSIEITHSNGAFRDKESGIVKYLWCIGTRRTLCDTVERTEITEPVLSITSDIAIFVDGQEYYVLLQAYNGAGLSASTTATTFVVDASAPVAGFVHEVEANTRIDIDYQVSSNHIDLVWGDFNDPQSPIVEYTLTIGSCPSCVDIANDIDVGLVEAYQINHLQLRPGTKYFTRVKACNNAGLCTTVSSDGVTVDGTPPHLGRVYDGLFGGDTDYQSKNNMVQVHLENVHDLQSGISFISWWAGTSPGAADIFHEETTHSHTVLQKTINLNITDGTTIYTTVKACNKAGLCTEKCSDGSRIDTTAPLIMSEPELIPTTGTFLSSSQVYRNTIALQWLATEDVAPIISTYVSILPQNDVHLLLPTAKLEGNPMSLILSDLDLRDGDVYVVKVTVCNGASLCTESVSREFMVDSSPPTSGAFAVDTDHAIELDRQREGWMTYDNAHTDGPQVRLAWVGFQDPHSDMLSYSVKIGTDLHTADIAQYEINHQTSDSHADEGFVMTENITISKAIQPHDHLYVTIYGTNKAGLSSDILQGLFISIPSGGDTGSLELERRCSTRSCIGHCTCAPHGFHGCDIVGSTCTDKTDDASYAKVTVYDTIPSFGSSTSSDVDYVPTLHILHATWTVDGDGIEPKWFDWSVGMIDESVGSGLLDINTQPIWYEAGNGSTAVFSMTISKLADEMRTHMTYVFYVKAWYDELSYAVFQSNGVQVDATAPELSDSYTVIEVFNPDSSADVDFTSSASTITIKWANVFRDGQSGLVSFEVTIYSDKLLSVIVSKQVTSDIVELTMAGLSLIHGEHYTAKVVACNNVALCTEALSDGFLVDTTPPHTGTVLDGKHFHDIEYTYESREVAASWQGFYDDESFIASYIWCITVGSVEISCTDVGLKEQMKILLPEEISSGEMVSFTVYAVNGANLTSIPVSSNGFIVDQLPPSETHWFKFGSSIVINGLLESNTDGWEINAAQTDVSENYVCIRNGDIKQDISTVGNQKYRLRFDVVNGNESARTPSLGYFQFGEKENQIVSVGNKNEDLHLRKKVHFVMAHNSTSILQLGTMTDTELCYGNIRLEPIAEGSREIWSSQHPEASFSSSVHVHVIASPLESTVVLNWDFVDLETPLVDHMFAVGTVKGGIQLQDFKSTGIKTTATLSGLKLPHGIILHVTVVATNVVGLSTVVYADPVIVDLTPPVLELFQVNHGRMVLSTLELPVTWQASDTEIGVETCELSIDIHNKSPVNVINFTWSSNGTKTVSLPDLKHLDTFTCSMNCKSFRDMYTKGTIGPLTYITEAPNTDSANVVIIPYSETFHVNRDNYQSSANPVWFRWDGIVDQVGIESCEISVTDGEKAVLEATSLGSNQHRALILQNSPGFLEHVPYAFNLTCFNAGGYAGEPVITAFHIDSTLPSYTGDPLEMNWPSDRNVQLNWSGLFTAASELTYELNLGTTPGGIDVLSWMETKDTELQVTNINSALTHYLSISAITQSGLYVTSNFVVTY